MARLNLILIKTVRFTGWPLLALVITYILTGYGMSGEYGFHRLIDERKAGIVHQAFHLPLLVLLLAHSLPAVYLAFWRWGWIGKRRT